MTWATNPLSPLKQEKSMTLSLFPNLNKLGKTTLEEIEERETNSEDREVDTTRELSQNQKTTFLPV